MALKSSSSSMIIGLLLINLILMNQLILDCKAKPTTTRLEKDQIKEKYRQDNERRKEFVKDGKTMSRDLSIDLIGWIRSINKYLRKDWADSFEARTESLIARFIIVPTVKLMSLASDLAAPFLVYYYVTAPLKRFYKDLSYVLDKPAEIFKDFMRLGQTDEEKEKEDKEYEQAKQQKKLKQKLQRKLNRGRVVGVDTNGNVIVNNINKPTG